MKFYLAATYSQHPAMQAHVMELAQLGHLTTSRWHQGAHDVADEPGAGERFAVEDIRDLDAADVVIHFAGNGARGRGGRHVELGRGKTIWHVGERENVFHHLLAVHVFGDWAALVTYLVTAYGRRG